MPWHLLPLLPLGILAGVLSGFLGIGGGLIFAPLLLASGLSPHQALATSTLAIVPTTLAGSWSHLRSGQVPAAAMAAITCTAAGGGVLFSHSGTALSGWHLLALQAVLYAMLTLVVTPRSALEAAGNAANDPSRPMPLVSLAGVGVVAGAASGLLGVGGGLVMVPLMVRALNVPVYLAIRLSTLAVCASAASASVGLVGDGRAQPTMALLLGGVAALAARWSAARLQRISEVRLIVLLRLLCGLLAVDTSRRALMLLQG